MSHHRSANKLLFFVLACAGLVALIASATSFADTPSSNGGATFTPPPPPPEEATIVGGVAIAPASAPTRVRRVIAAANRLINKPYRYGGGHRPYTSRLDRGYDCSGSVSFALHGGRFLKSPLPSGMLMNWGRRGPGTWITVYAHGSHAYMVVAGLRFDTSMRDADAPGPRTGPRWSRSLREAGGFVARHPRGY